MKKNSINPALKSLESFAGKWAMQIYNASFLPDLSDTIESTALFEWVEGGDFLALRQGTKETPHATWLISRDQDAQNYTVLYLDDRKFSRVYEMSFKNGIWKMWRNAPKFVQRFEGKLSRDKNTIKGLS